MQRRLVLNTSDSTPALKQTYQREKVSESGWSSQKSHANLDIWDGRSSPTPTSKYDDRTAPHPWLWVFPLYHHSAREIPRAFTPCKRWFLTKGRKSRRWCRLLSVQCRINHPDGKSKAVRTYLCKGLPHASWRRCLAHHTVWAPKGKGARVPESWVA